MGYIQDVEAELTGYFNGLALTEKQKNTLIRYLKAKILESYKNGLRDGRRPKPKKQRKEKPGHGLKGSNFSPDFKIED